MDKSQLARLRGAGLLLLVLSLPCSTTGVAAQAAARPGAAELQALDQARRLRDIGRLLEAGQQIEAVLADRPASIGALSLLYEVTGDLDDPGSFVPFAERAAAITGSETASVYSLWVRGLVRALAFDSAGRVGERWVRERPTEGLAYIELSRAQLAAGDEGSAVRTLTAGSEATGQIRRFAGELARVHIRQRDLDRLAAQWLTVLAAGPDGVQEVLTSRQDLGPDLVDALDALWVAGRKESVSAESQWGIAQLGLFLGDPREARAAAERGLGLSSSRADATRLQGYVRTAARQALPAEAGWAAVQLSARATSRADRMRWLAVAAQSFLEANHLEDARPLLVTLLAETEPGSGNHHFAARSLGSLEAGDPSLREGASRRLAAYAAWYPDSTIVHTGLVVELSRGYARAGRLAAAHQALDGWPADSEHVAAAAMVDGQRAMLALYEGKGRDVPPLLQRPVAALDLDAAQRTRWIQLLAIAQKADSTALAQLGSALLDLLRSPESFQAEGLLEEWGSVPVGGVRPAMLAYVGAELEALGRREEAAHLYAAVVESYPDQVEAASALLALARLALPADGAAAGVWLEQLITGHPESALAPVARRMLAELDALETAP